MPKLAAVALAVAALAVHVAGATAEEFVLEPAGPAEIEGSFRVFGEIGSVICNVTLGMELNQVVEKAEGAPAGDFTEWTSSECVSNFGGGANSIRFLFEREIEYSSFEGVLPNELTALRLRIPTFALLARIQTPTIIIGCLWEGNAELTLEMPEASNITFKEEGSVLELVNGLEAGFLCSETLTLFGSGALSPEQTIEFV